VIHYRNPAVSGQAMTPVTGERIWEQIGGRFIAHEVRQSKHWQSWWRLTSLKHQSRCTYQGHRQHRRIIWAPKAHMGIFS